MTPNAQLHRADVDVPDQVLIRDFLAGEDAAFGVLYHRHTPRLQAIVRRLLGTRANEMDDVVQETWIAGCRGLSSFNGSARFSTWLTTIGIRAVQNRLRVRTWAEAELTDDIEAPPAMPGTTVMDLERAIGRLPAHQRAVLVLHDVHGFTHEEIGAQLGVATGTSKGTLSRARMALRRMLADHGGTE